MSSATDPVQTDDLEQVEEPERTALINQRRSEQPVILQNTIRAADSILVRLSAEQRSELHTVLEKVVDRASVSAIRLQAQQLQRRLDATAPADA
jgi:nicotinamide riboside kinase